LAEPARSETFTNEGTHVGDDIKFLNSFNTFTFGYNQMLNISHGQAVRVAITSYMLDVRGSSLFRGCNRSNAPDFGPNGRKEG
jgi:hypothetical protein